MDDADLTDERTPKPQLTDADTENLMDDDETMLLDGLTK